MDVYPEDAAPEAAMAPAPALGDAPAVAVPANGRPSAAAALRQLIRLRDHTRVELHRQLDDLLDLPTQDPDDTVLDEIVREAAQGFGVQVRVHTEHPQKAGQVAEDPSVTAESMKPKSAIHLLDA